MVFKGTEEEIEVNGIRYVQKYLTNKMGVEKNGLKCVLIRSNSAGVHFGYLKKEEFTLCGKVVVLLDTRRIWYWNGAASLSQIALEGVLHPKDCKFSVEIPEIEIVNVVETIPLTEKAVKNLYGVPVWKA